MDRTFRNVRDAGLIETKALPNGANTIYTDAFDLGALTGRGVRPDGVDLLITAPALVVGDLGNGDTMTYDVQMDTDSAFGSPTTLQASAIVQTGANAAGAAAATKRITLPPDTERYVRVKVVNSAAGDASDKEVTAELLV